MTSAPPPVPATHVCPKCKAPGQVGQFCAKDNLYFVDPVALDRINARIHHLGQLIDGHYAVVGLLGQGGMATVYLAIDINIGSRVALKILRANLQTALAAQERFMREARAISSMHSKRLISCYDFGIDDGIPYMAMEVLEGATLGVFLTHREPAAEEMACIAFQLLEGIAVIHDHKVIHRDLKPTNVMVCDAGPDEAGVKIIDFGLARLRGGRDTEPLTRHGDVLGTARYLSPEHTRGSRYVGPPSDIYAYGIILYELITGDSPFDAPTPVEMIRMHLECPVPPMVPRPGLEISPVLESFILRCLEKNPEKRFENGRVALEALELLGVPRDETIDLTRNWAGSGAVPAVPHEKDWGGSSLLIEEFDSILISVDEGSADMTHDEEGDEPSFIDFD